MAVDPRDDRHLPTHRPRHPVTDRLLLGLNDCPQGLSADHRSPSYSFAGAMARPILAFSAAALRASSTVPRLVFPDGHAASRSAQIYAIMERALCHITDVVINILVPRAPAGARHGIDAGKCVIVRNGVLPARRRCRASSPFRRGPLSICCSSADSIGRKASTCCFG